MPSDTIIIKTKVDGKYPKVQTVMGKSYSLAKGISLDNFEIGGAYAIEYEERTVPNKDKPGEVYTFKDITAVRVGTTPQKQPEMAQTTPPTPKVIEPVSTPPLREIWMARECALKCSVELIKAWVEICKANGEAPGTSEVKAKQEEYYKSFIETITGDIQIPF